MERISPFLWFDGEAEEAAKFYVSIFPNSKIKSVARYGEAGKEVHGRAPGSVMTVAFELDGQRFTALNGGPAHKFNEAVSFVVNCSNQQEIDHYWDRLSAGGEEIACGWLKDRYGVAWQIVPSVLPKFLQIGGALAESVMAALLQMKKLDIAELERAARTKADHIRTALAGKRVRVTWRGEVIADSRDALAMKEGDLPLVYYFPRKDVKMERLTRTEQSTHCPFKGDASYYSIGNEAKDAVWSYEQPFAEMAAIKGHLAFYPDRVDSISIG